MSTNPLGASDDPGKEPRPSPEQVAQQARDLQLHIDELVRAIQQAHQQQLKPQYIEEMLVQLAKLRGQFMKLFE